MCRKQWATPRGSLLFVNADMTSSSTDSVTDSDTAVTTADTLQSLPGSSLPCFITTEQYVGVACR